MNQHKIGIKILGTGCNKCNELEHNTKEAIKNLNIVANIEHINDLTQIAIYGVMLTPALVINERVVSTGKVLKTAEIEKLIKLGVN